MVLLARKLFYWKKKPMLWSSSDIRSFCSGNMWGREQSTSVTVGAKHLSAAPEEPVRTPVRMMSQESVLNLYKRFSGSQSLQVLVTWWYAEEMFLNSEIVKRWSTRLIQIFLFVGHIHDHVMSWELPQRQQYDIIAILYLLRFSKYYDYYLWCIAIYFSHILRSLYFFCSLCSHLGVVNLLPTLCSRLSQKYKVLWTSEAMWAE